MEDFWSILGGALVGFLASRILHIIELHYKNKKVASGS